MPPKATSPAPPFQPSATDPRGVAGKWIVIGIFGLALAGAVGSWIFRYYATHRAARFWGTEAARLIRDAPQVDFYYLVDGEATLNHADLLEKLTQPGVCGKVDVSQARGIVHLRNALVEDRSFDWRASPKEPPPAGWMLRFNDPATKDEVWIAFAEAYDFCRLLGEAPGAEIISCEPIADGLQEVFNEYSAMPQIVPLGYH
jgi:hypothetical protein